MTTAVNPRVLQVRHRRHPARWAGAALILLLTIAIVFSMATNPRFEWNVVGEYLFQHAIWAGVLNTIWLTVIAMIVGTVLGTLLAVLRLSPNPLLSSPTAFYVWFFRATPLLVQLLFWYNLGALYPNISLGIPGVVTFFSASANDVIGAWTAALLGLSLHQAAHTAEIVRAGILSVDPGQREAATALGMPPRLALRRIVLPQAMRAIVPPMGNEVISMMKTTSLVSIIALPELLNTAQTIYARTYETIPMLIVATIWYLALTGLLMIAQSFLERHYGRGATTTPSQLNTLSKQLRERLLPPSPTTPTSIHPTVGAAK
ncbi:MAG: amino acid ABC transporter permease [Mycobacterium sp.]